MEPIEFIHLHCVSRNRDFCRGGGSGRVSKVSNEEAVFERARRRTESKRKNRRPFWGDLAKDVPLAYLIFGSVEGDRSKPYMRDAPIFSYNFRVIVETGSL
jgi:hypothetical protein